MAHIFFERLEDRQSTQTLLPSLTPIAIYSAQIPNPWGTGIGGYTPTNPSLLYGISPYPGGTSPTTPILYYGVNPSPGGYYPWGGYYGGMFGLSSYNPFSWGSWGGFGNMFSPFMNFFGGLFGGLFGGYSMPWGYNNPIYPDFRMLYGIFPYPSQPTNIVTYYGVLTGGFAAF